MATEPPPPPVATPPANVETRATDLVIRLAILGLFAYWSLRLVAPFLPIMLWAVILAVALSPVFSWLANLLGGRRKLAAAIVTVLALAVVLGPIAVLATSLAETLLHIADGLARGEIQVPPPPAGLAEIPVIGEPAGAAWTLASTNLEDAVGQYGPALLPAGGVILGKVAAISGDVLLFLVSVAVAGFLLVPGPRLGNAARRFAGRILAPRGAHFVDLAGATIRNVSRGVIGVAALQALLAGVALVAFGVPGAGLFAFLVLLSGIVQLGPALPLIPALIWGWMELDTGTAVAFTLVIVAVTLVDNVLKPLLMGRGLKTPTLVILVGVIGGALSYGLIGIFLGPIVLAVFYELTVAWVELEPPRPTPAAGLPAASAVPPPAAAPPVEPPVEPPVRPRRRRAGQRRRD